MTTSRRAFLGGAAALAAGLPSCGRLSYSEAGVCNPPAPSGPIRIDMHCHLMNVRDVSGPAFATRRIFNLEEDASPTVEAIANGLVQALVQVLKGSTWSIQRERGFLRAELNRPLDLTPEGGKKPAHQSNRDFCFFAGKNQPGFFRAGAQRQITGFFSTRIRNAARMMALYPDMDLFLPSIVDLYEGETIAEYVQQIAFYADLNLATRGRFLPLASFTPEREYEDRTLFGRSPDDPDRPSQFYWLKHAIDNLGFVGVKVHPSSGFSPHDNLRLGCLNTPRQRVRETDQELFDQFSAYDTYMEELYAFCKSRDVPILTHNSTGISANTRCMRGAHPDGHADNRLRPVGDIGDPDQGEWRYAFRTRENRGLRDESDWTNSPTAWAAAIDKADAANPGDPGLRVILSHFADAFDRDPKRGRTYRLAASRWLRDAGRLTRSRPGLSADLSELNEMFTPGTEDGYKQVFQAVLRAYPSLTRNLMYGSDWHMPATADTGSAYPDLIRSLLPQGSKDAVMGLNAARIFRLRPGDRTRARLARFYADPPAVTGAPRKVDNSLALSDISWWSRV